MAALPLALLVALTLPSLAGRTVVVLLVAFWMLATQVRLSDHCWLGAVAVTVMAFTPASLHSLVALDLLAGVYLTAALLKVNGEYLCTERSAGRVVTAHYLHLLRLPDFPRLVKSVPVAVIAVELVAGVLACAPGSERCVLWLAILMHLVFGVSGNFPFSVVAMALWVAVFTPDSHITLAGASWIVGAGALLAGLLGLFGGRTAMGPRSTGWLVKDFYQGAVYGALCAMAVLPPAAGATGPGSWTPLVHGLIALVFAVNFALVVAGVKLEWSFAMFTSLRPFGQTWLERHRLRDWPRYYALSLPSRMPKSLLRDVDPTFLYLATRDENVVHEGVVFHLEAVARQHRVTFAPQAMMPVRERRVLVPADPPQPAPRRRLLDYPAVVPKSLNHRYLA
ncbi:hypothetical protein [Streptomyces spiralis]